MMNARISPLFAGLALILAACNASGPPPLAGAKMGGAFELVNQDGKVARDSDFSGKYRLVYFGYAFCPDVCPVDLQALMQGYRSLEKNDPDVAAKVQPIFITVDPARDTPPAIKQFVGAFHPKLVGLTGTPEQIAAVAKKYGVYFQAGEKRTDGSYLVDHSRTAVLYGKAGEPIALIPHDGKPDAIAAEIKRWAD
jgi:protein SCO1